MKVRIGNRLKIAMDFTKVELISAAINALPEEYRDENSYFVISDEMMRVVIVVNRELPRMCFSLELNVWHVMQSK